MATTKKKTPAKKATTKAKAAAPKKAAAPDGPSPQSSDKTTSKGVEFSTTARLIAVFDSDQADVTLWQGQKNQLAQGHVSVRLVLETY